MVFLRSYNYVNLKTKQKLIYVEDFFKDTLICLHLLRIGEEENSVFFYEHDKLSAQVPRYGVYLHINYNETGN